jgi:hypothetical protein
LALAVCASCDNGYPLPPTPCDDWCLVLQRAGCEEDWPEKCVSGCESELRASRGCEDEWQARYACYQQASDDDFFCGDELSRLRAGICDDEQEALWECSAPLASRCGKVCEMLAEACPDTELESCWESCVAVSSSEDSAIAFLDCVRDEPLDCTAPLLYETSACSAAPKWSAFSRKTPIGLIASPAAVP